MCVCVCVRVCVRKFSIQVGSARLCVYACTHVHMFLSVCHICLHLCKFVRKYTCAHVCMYVCLYKHSNTPLFSDRHTSKFDSQNNDNI